MGFLFWYSAVSRLSWGLGVDATFVVAMVAGVALAFLTWYAYGQYFARRAGVEQVAAMQWDALSWALLGVYPLAFALPVNVITPSRASFAAIGLWALTKLLIAARVVPTVRDVLLTFTATRVAIIVIAELAAANGPDSTWPRRAIRCWPCGVAGTRCTISTLHGAATTEPTWPSFRSTPP